MVANTFPVPCHQANHIFYIFLPRFWHFTKLFGAELEGKEEEIKTLKADLAQSKNDYNNLKLAKMIEVSDADVKESKMKITRLVREINKCINMLSSDTPVDGSDTD